MTKAVSLLKFVAARAIVEPLITRGMAPLRGPVRSLFFWTLRNRDLQLRSSHPVHAVAYRQPFDSTWALNRAAMAWLWAHLHKTQPRVVVEMGSGRSTAMLALWARGEEAEGRFVPRIVSIEHDPTWAVEIEAFLRELGAERFVDLRLCSLVKAPEGGYTYAIDGEDLLATLAYPSVDLLLIDGPPGPGGRRNTLPLVQHVLAPGAQVFLDDAMRIDESETVNAWQSTYRDTLKLVGILPFGNGLAWFIKQSTEHTSNL